MEVVLLNLLRVFGLCFHGFWPFGVLVVDCCVFWWCQVCVCFVVCGVGLGLGLFGSWVGFECWGVLMVEGLLLLDL